MSVTQPKLDQRGRTWARLLVDAAPSAMLVIDSERRIVQVNQGVEHLFGYARAELLGQFVEVLLPERYSAEHPHHVRSFLEAPQTRPMGGGRDLYGRCKDGTEVALEIGLSPIETDIETLVLASIVDVTRRKRDEERFRLVVEAAPCAMIIIDAERKMVLVNERSVDLFGYTQAELLGQTIELLVPERFRSQHPHFVQAFLAEPKARSMGAGRELYGRRKDGQEIPVEIGLNPIATQDGLLIVASIIDISERKRADAAHERLAALVESSTDAIISKTLAGVITSWNHGAEVLFGYTAQQIIGHSIGMLVPPQLAEQEALILHRLRNNEVVEHFETLRRCADGRDVEVSVTLSQIRNAAGEITGISSIARDITVQKRSQRLLEAINHAQLRFVEDDSPSGMYDGILHDLIELTKSRFGFVGELMYSADGQPQLAVRAMSDVAWSKESREQYHQFISGELAFTNLNSLFGAVVKTGRLVIANDAANDPRRGSTPPGHPPLIRFLGLPLHANDSLVGVIGLANSVQPYTYDQVEFLVPMLRGCANMISAHKSEQEMLRTQAELAASNARLEDTLTELRRSNAELEQFAYVASHDLQEPLRMVANFTQLLAQKYEGQLDERAQKYIAFAVDGAKRMQLLVADLLAYSRVGSQGRAFVVVSTTSLVQSVVASLHAVITDNNAVIQLGELPKVLGDETQLRQLFQNLIGNALKFRSDAAPRIQVGARRAGHEYTFFVKDNGIGLEMRFAERIFEMFQRLHERGRYDGSGIGLAIAKRIVERHHGRIWVESTLGNGTTFFFTLLPADSNSRDIGPA